MWPLKANLQLQSCQKSSIKPVFPAAKNILFYLFVPVLPKADKDSAEAETTDKPVVQQKKEGPSSSEKVDKMCKFIYSRDTSDRIRTRAMLCHVYHHALHDRWFEARDLMLCRICRSLSNILTFQHRFV